VAAMLPTHRFIVIFPGHMAVALKKILDHSGVKIQYKKPSSQPAATQHCHAKNKVPWVDCCRNCCCKQQNSIAQ